MIDTLVHIVLTSKYTEHWIVYTPLIVLLLVFIIGLLNVTYDEKALEYDDESDNNIKTADPFDNTGDHFL